MSQMKALSKSGSAKSPTAPGGVSGRAAPVSKSVSGKNPETSPKSLSTSKMAKSRSATGTKPKCVGAVVAGYEKVTPRTDQRDLHKWWAEKEKRDRRLFLVKVVGVFTLVVAGSLTMIALGTKYYLAKMKKLRELDTLDPRLTTKTSLCRAANPGLDPNCVFEIEDEHGNCQYNGTHCKALRWIFKVTAEEGADFVQNETTMQLEDSTYADCDYLKWCRYGTCYPSKVKPERWWPEMDTKPFQDDAPLSSEEAAATSLRCVHIDPSDKRSTETYRDIVRDYGGHCNHSVCASGAVQFSLRVAFDPCDSDQDFKTGIRKRLCNADHKPMKLAQCRPCKQYKSGSERDYLVSVCTKGGQTLAQNDDLDDPCRFNCSVAQRTTTHFAPPGFKCKTPQTSDGVCFQGRCYTAAAPEE